MDYWLILTTSEDVIKEIRRHYAWLITIPFRLTQSQRRISLWHSAEELIHSSTRDSLTDWRSTHRLEIHSLTGDSLTDWRFTHQLEIHSPTGDPLTDWRLTHRLEIHLPTGVTDVDHFSERAVFWPLYMRGRRTSLDLTWNYPHSTSRQIDQLPSVYNSWSLYNRR